MRKLLWFDKTGVILALITLFVSWYIFTSDSSMIFRSFFAALLTSGLVWISYIMLKWLVVAIRGE